MGDAGLRTEPGIYRQVSKKCHRPIPIPIFLGNNTTTPSSKAGPSKNTALATHGSSLSFPRADYVSRCLNSLIRFFLLLDFVRMRVNPWCDQTAAMLFSSEPHRHPIHQVNFGWGGGGENMTSRPVWQATSGSHPAQNHVTGNWQQRKVLEVCIWPASYWG